jgi:hypothetical protein
VSKKRRAAIQAEPQLDWSESLVMQLDSTLAKSQALNMFKSDFISVPLPMIMDYPSGLARVSYYADLFFTLLLFFGAVLFIAKVRSAYLFNLNLWRIMLSLTLVIIILNGRIVYAKNDYIIDSLLLDGQYVMHSIGVLFMNIVFHSFVARSKRIRTTYIMAD